MVNWLFFIKQRDHVCEADFRFGLEERHLLRCWAQLCRLLPAEAVAALIQVLRVFSLPWTCCYSRESKKSPFCPFFARWGWGCCGRRLRPAAKRIPCGGSAVGGWGTRWLQEVVVPERCVFAEPVLGCGLERKNSYIFADRGTLARGSDMGQQNVSC